ncbi:MAG: helix-turn-helix domain-containing protein [Bryobacteraceae bacterium]
MGDRRLTTSARLTGMYLIERAGQNDTAWPSLATISDGLGLSERQIRYNLRALEAAGWIAQSSRPGRTSVFTLLDRQPGDGNAGGQPIAGVGGQPIAGEGGNPLPPNQSLNQSLESSSSESVEFDEEPTTTEPISNEPERPEEGACLAEADPGDIETVQKKLHAHTLYRFHVSRHVAEQVFRVLDRDLAVVDAYLSIAKHPDRGGGFYLRDCVEKVDEARARVPEMLEEAAAKAAAGQAEADRRLAAEQAAEEKRLAAEKAAARRACPGCKGAGYFEGADGYAWCRCIAGEEERAARGDAWLAEKWGGIVRVRRWQTQQHEWFAIVDAWRNQPWKRDNADFRRLDKAFASGDGDTRDRALVELRAMVEGSQARKAA